MTRWGAPVLLAALAVIPTGPAQAAPAAGWTRVAAVPAADRSTFDAGLARAPGGTLHVIYTRAGGGVAHRALSASGRRLSAPHAVAGFGGGVNPSVALVAGPAGLRAFFAGLQEGTALDRVLATSASADGRAWTPAAPVSSATAPYAASGLAAAFGADGVPVAAWGSAGEGFHVGLDPAAPDGLVPGGGASGPGIGVDSASGQVVLAWDRVDAGKVAAQSISPAGPLVAVPASGAVQALHRVGVTGRIGAPGAYVAYTAGSNEFTGRAAVWRFGAVGGMSVSSRGARHVTISAAPEGRLWVLWDRDGRIYARRSDRAAARYGRLVSLPAPRRSGAIHDLACEGSSGPLDVLALVERRGGSAEWHRRLLPALSLAMRRGARTVAMAVTDAGDPVGGARVAISGVGSKRTGRSGVARFELPGGRYRVTAARKGYSPASARVRVNR